MYSIKIIYILIDNNFNDILMLDLLIRQSFQATLYVGKK